MANATQQLREDATAPTENLTLGVDRVAALVDRTNALLDERERRAQEDAQ